MILYIVLIVDLFLLAMVVGVAFKFMLKIRRLLKEQLEQADVLKHQNYLSEVLREVEERMGYTHDPVKFLEVLVSSLNNLLEYDVAGYLALPENGRLVYRSHVNASVDHKFLDSVKAKVFASASVLAGVSSDTFKNVDESITGALLDDNLRKRVEDYFCVPIFLSGRFEGVFLVSSSKRNTFKLSHYEVLFATVTQASRSLSRLKNILENEREKLVSIINSMTDGVVMVNNSLELQVSNPALKQLLEIKGQNDVSIYDLVDSLGGKLDIRSKLEQAMKSRNPVRFSPIKMNNYVLDLTVTPVRSMNGDELGAVAVFRDITTEKELEGLKQDYTAMMVHELRAPLTAVRWAGEALVKDVQAGVLDKEKISQSADNVVSASGSMLELVSDFLDIAKLESGRFELNIQEADLVQLITDKSKVYRDLAEAKHLQFSFRLPDKLVVHCDRVRIGQVVNNLLSNALKYTDSGEVEVSLTTDLAKNMAVVAVKDSGVGLNREDLPQLFSKFRRLHNAENSRQGTGLGLAICKGIVEAHGGQIWVESLGENLGSTFYFGLPLSGKNKN